MGVSPTQQILSSGWKALSKVEGATHEKAADEKAREGAVCSCHYSHIILSGTHHWTV